MLRGSRACQTCYEDATELLRKSYEETDPVQFSLNVHCHAAEQIDSWWRTLFFLVEDLFCICLFVIQR